MKNRELFNEYAREILESEVFLKNKGLISHGAISMYSHCLAVAALSFSMVEEDARIDRRCVVRAALLHDFFLYECHQMGLRYVLHGWIHAKIAAEKARELFNINDKEYSCIRTHMWPWTLFHPPRYREGWVISLADKIVALRETIFGRSRKHPQAVRPELC
jgi:uncharacterized protein